MFYKKPWVMDDNKLVVEDTCVGSIIRFRLKKVTDELDGIEGSVLQADVMTASNKKEHYSLSLKRCMSLKSSFEGIDELTAARKNMTAVAGGVHSCLHSIH